MTPPLVDHEALKDVRLLLLDVDGVLTDGGLYFGPGQTEPTKRFHVRDGMGIALLQRAGIATGVVSGRADEFVRRRAEELRMSVVELGVERKDEVISRVLSERGLEPAQAAFLGDDVNDIPAFEQVGVPLAVADAHPQVLDRVRFVTRARGGNGAVREVADAILGVELAPRSDAP